MSQIDTIVNLNISRQTAQIDITAFDIPLILVEMDANMEAEFTDRVRTYTSLEGVAGDFPTDHAAYKMAEKLLSNDLRPNEFKIGKKSLGETYVGALHAVNEFDDTWYALLVDSHEDEDIYSLASAIQGMRKLYFTSTDSSDALSQNLDPKFVATVQYNVFDPESGDKVAVRIQGNTFESEYDGTEWTSFAYIGEGDVGFMGNFDLDVDGLLTIESSEMFVVGKATQTTGGVVEEVDSSNISETNPEGLDIGQRLKAKDYFRTIVVYSKTANVDYPEASWVGGQLPEVAGSISWEYKGLTGVTVSSLTDTEINILENRNYNYYIPIKGVNVIRRGKTIGEGEWIDTVQVMDWIHARMQEQIFFRLVNVRKIPFTDGGMTIIENEIRSVLSQAQANGAIDEYSVIAPRALDIPEMERARRNAEGFKFTARLQGAISTVRIDGVLTV